MKEEQHNTGQVQPSAQPELSHYHHQAAQFARENNMLRAVLDSASPEASALRFHHFFRPSLAIGGDFFQILQISDSVAGVLICDVMGHGVRAALVAAILHALVQGLRGRATEPARFLQELNRGISQILKHTRLTMFVSACYLLVDIARGELRYANAGHPTPPPV